MRRTFDIDVMRCPKCGPPPRFALWRDKLFPKSKISPKLALASEGGPTEIPTTVPARASPQQEELDFYPYE
jgi:hypothetical protein